MLEPFGGRNFVIKYEGSFKYGNAHCLVLEHVEHDRPEVIKRETNVFQVQWYVYCLFKALVTLHKQLQYEGSKSYPIPVPYPVEACMRTKFESPDWREPFNLQKGWLLWAGIGLAGALASIIITGAVMSLVRGENPQRETSFLHHHRPSSQQDLIYDVLHPLLTVIGFIVISGEAILVHRWLPGSRNLKKSVHLCLQGVALASGMFGIWTRFLRRKGSSG